MQITTVAYGKTFNLGHYESLRIDLTATLDAGAARRGGGGRTASRIVPNCGSRAGVGAVAAIDNATPRC
jgi:hypothetical protein